MFAVHASRGERRREFPLLCCLEGTEAALTRGSPVRPRRSRRRSRLPLHVGRLPTGVLFLARNVSGLVIELGSLVEEPRRARIGSNFPYRAALSSVIRNSFQKIDVPVL